MRRDVAFVVLCSFCYLGYASADEIVMKGGGQLTGRVVQRTASAVTIEIDAGRITVPASAVESVVAGPTDLAAYDARAARLSSTDTKGWLDLALWAQQHGLAAAAARAFKRVLLLDPGNAVANRAIGNALVDGHWLSSDDAKRARGLVRFDGEWVTPAEQQARLAERRDALEQERAQQESASRALEAQASAEAADAQQASAEPVPWGFDDWPFGWPTAGFVAVTPGYYGFHRHFGPGHGDFRGRHRRLGRAAGRRSVAGGRGHSDTRVRH